MTCPLRLAGGISIPERKGLLVYNPESGGWGDAAPLPGFSKESVEEIQDEFHAERDGANRFPSVRFAVECAGSEPGFSVPPVGVNFLWVPAMEPLGDLLKRLETVMAPVVKIKLGPEPDLHLVRELLSARRDVRFRLDPNRRWTPETLVSVFQKLPEDSLDYIEEPLPDPEQYSGVWDRMPVPIGLDESLLEGVRAEIAAHPHVKALVIKPTLMGNAADRAPWIRLAAESGKQVVWSSCFESGVGLWHLARLASETGGAASGLDTGRVFLEDLVEPRPLPSGGMLECKGWSLRPEMLEGYEDSESLNR
jgi:O-succinylbenzoate synthase